MTTLDHGADDRTRIRPAGGPVDPQELSLRQRDRFGGMKFGCSFFGWLTATGMTVLLTGLTAAVAAGLGLSGLLGAGAPDESEMRRLGLAGGVVLLVIVLLAYFCGGYVAARMARFSGAKQGLGVWLWAVVATVVLAVLGFVAGSNLDLPSTVTGLSQLRVNTSALTTTGGLVTAGAIALISLVGALLGGLAGMRYHRRVDRTPLEEL